MIVIADWSKRDEIKGVVTPTGVMFEDPASEPAGVDGRRVAWSHPFVHEDLEWIEDTFVGVQIVESLPSDWRHPDTFQ